MSIVLTCLPCLQASTLRYELELNKQNNNRLRKEKLDEEKELVEKVVNLEKTIAIQKSEMEFKNIANIKSRTPAKSLSIRTSRHNDTQNAARTISDRETFAWFELHLPIMPLKGEPISSS